MIKKILFIRRDNIGDLVCTTPAIAAARLAFPEAKIGLLVNTYNVDAVSNNPDIDELYVYEKAKHVPEKNKISVWIDNARLLLRIRKENYDVAIGCGSFSARLGKYTRMTGAKMRIGYSKNAVDASKWYTSPLIEPDGPLHEAERTLKLLSPLGVDGMQPLRVMPSPDAVGVFTSFADSAGGIKRPFIALHISSRKPENRWPAESFVLLARQVVKRYGARILLLWSPGSEKNVYHPGDDEKADLIMGALGRDVMAYPTRHLSELIAALSAVDAVVCGDGGAMHLAAGLGKPIAAIWGSTNVDRWRPFGVRHAVIESKSRKAADVEVAKVFNALEGLL